MAALRDDRFARVIGAKDNSSLTGAISREAAGVSAPIPVNSLWFLRELYASASHRASGAESCQHELVGKFGSAGLVAVMAG
ncbi:hypothetical protein, partial [Mycolicibacterium houstonense]|uniref:hypothetical protein n=1 Tax=Mycolicibacterium houstonense TaxID=146021 RepID=UPI001C659A94